MMTSAAVAAAAATDDILRELDHARARGPLQHITIPPCPELLSRLQRALAEPEPDLNEVARIATSDVAMSATLLKQANSPAFSTGQPVQTIGQAMNRLGLAHTAGAMTAFLTRRAIRVNSPHLTRFWERSAKRATAMSYLAGKLPGVSADLAHTYGLFCHVGLPVMVQSIKGYTGTMVEARARIDRSYVQTENANHKTDHAVVGALVARVWRLSPTVTAGIRLHHDLEALGERSADPEANTLIALGLVAEYITVRHEGVDPDADWTRYGEAAMAWLEVQPEDLHAWEDELHELLHVV
ncbi:HDOD domain-containing protein [Aquabacterium fontiphilum]|jgi:HD-like signal output (HDOD) protein|uniref:HDOD domain-containing protein n=1 Tax=Aquabacterium fontiphilum TaxID=450365 RepID=UPI001F4153A0|nr:HDOD domain-containing protein [Aquabacterium fontiphilum]